MIKSRAKLLNFCLLCLLIVSVNTKAQTTVTIGDINTTYYSERYPFNGYYNYSWSNMLYLNSEVGAAGQITQISFFVTNSPVNYVMNNQKIYVRNTTVTSFTNATYTDNTQFTQVYNGTISYNGTGWKTITFSTPFNYDGTSNLEFLFENQDATWANGFPYFAYTTSTGSNRIRRDYKDASFPSSCTNCLALNSILNIQLTKQCANSMTIAVSSASVCSGSSTTLTANGASTYTWSPSASLNISNGTSVIATPSASTIYTITGLDDNNCSQTKTLSVSVLALPNLTVTPNTPSVCVGGSTTLTAIGATNYTWSPATGLNASTTASVIANPTITTIYTITGNGSNNCVNTKTTTLTVYSNPAISVTPNSTTICNGGITNLVASGASTFTWSPSNGLSATNTSSVNANPTSTTIYTIIGSSAGCNGSATATVSVSNVNVGTAIATGSGNVCSNSQVSLSLDSKQAVAIGTGTLNIEKYPFNGYYNYSWSDAIYTQSDIGAAGNISKISFYVDNAPSNYTMLNQLIYIRNTSATSFTDNVYPGISGFTQVYNGSITYNGSGLKEITFTTPYNYNGTDNLEILFENRDGSYAAGFPLFRFSYVSSARVKRDYLDANFPSTCTNCGVFSNIPNVSFTIDRTLSTFVKWQSSYDNTTYTDLSGATTQSYSTQAKTSTYYRAQLTNGSCNAYSAPTFYVTNNNYYVNDNSTTGDIYTSAIGSSTNTGKSPSSPKASINDVLATFTLSPCDTIFVDKGTYTEEVNITSINVGNSQGYVVITGAGIDVSILNAPTSKNNIVLNQSSYLKIEKFTLNSTQSTYNNINIQQATGNVIANNKLVHSTSSNINLIGASIRANKNEFLNNQISNSSSSGYGIAVIGNSDSVIIRGNTITMSNTNSLSGIIVSSTKISNDIYYPAFGAIDQNTISAQNYGLILYGPDFPISSYTISNNNITIANKTLTDGSAIWLGSVGNSSAEKTVIYNNRLTGGKNGIYLSAGVNYEKIYNNYISNSDNGLYVSASSSSVGELYFNSFYNAVNNLYFYSSSSAYWKIKNNILYNTSTSASNACIRVGNPITFVACNNNLYYAPNGASIGIYNAVNYSTLINWKAIDHADETTNGDENSVYGNPLYVDATQNNLDITSSSPAASSGAAITGITKDIYDIIRLTPPFIGAQEFLFSLALCNTQTITCAIPTATLTGVTLASGVTYSWMGPDSEIPAGSSPSTSLTVVSAAGVYTLTITNSVNQSISSTVQVVANNTLPNVSAGSTQTITTSAPSVTLTGSSTTIGATYSWTPGGSTATSNTTTVSSPGVYTLSVTDSINGCVNSATVLVAVKLSVSANITDYENDSLKGIANLTIIGGTPPYNVAWNGLKLPTPTVAYHFLLDSLPGMTVDSVQFKNMIDSLRQRTVFNNLEPSTYSVTVYDQANDSVILNISVGAKINSWALTNGVSISTNNINSRTVDNINYSYGSGTSIVQQGIFSAGNSFAVPLSSIDLTVQNEMSFVVPNNTDIAYVGMRQDTLTLNGDTTDLNQKTMFRFNGNGTFDVVYQAQSIFNSTFSSGDQFALRTNFIPGKITYYKNEIEIAQADVSQINNVTSGFKSKVVLGNADAEVSGLKIKFPFVSRPSPNFHCFIISFLYPLIVSANPNPVCIGSTTQLNGQLTLPGAAVLLPSAYNWQPGNLSGPSPLPVTISVAQVYTLNVTYSGCVLKKTISVSLFASPIVNINPSSVNICSGAAVILSANVTSGIVSTYLWQLNGTNIGTNLSNYSASLPGDYKVVVTNSDGCSSISPILNITESSPILFSPPYSINVPSSSPFILGSNPLVTGGTTPYIFDWSQSSISFSSLQNPTISGITATSIYNVVVTDNNLCTASQNYAVNIITSYTDSYATLKKQLDAGYYQVQNGKLFFKFQEEYKNTSQLNYKIYDEYRSNVLLTPPTLPVTIGSNQFLIDLTSYGSFVNASYYTIEVQNEKKEKFVLKFKYDQ